MPKLTDDQRHAIDAENGAPVFVFDEERHVTYVLLPLQEYQRIRPMFDETGFQIRETYVLQDFVARAGGWEEGSMDGYSIGPFPQAA